MSTDRHALPEPGPSRSLSRERFERIYRCLRERICLLEYAPGSLLAEVDLAREFAVSRTPIRRVLSRLEAEGLVESRHGVGTLVTDVDLHQLSQVYELRMALATLIGSLSPRPREAADLERMRILLTRCEQLAAQPDGKAFARLNMEFFHELAAMVGNQPLRTISERLYFLTTRIWLKMVPQLNLADEFAAFRRELGEVLAAMELGDLDAVGHIRRAHISMSFARLQRYAVQTGKTP